MTIKKKGDALQVLVGGTSVAEYEKGVPAALQFDAMSFDLTGTSPEDKMFIGNIKVARN